MFLLIFAQFGKYIFNVSSVMNTYFLCVTVNKNFPLIIYFTSVYVTFSIQIHRWYICQTEKWEKKHSVCVILNICKTSTVLWRISIWEQNKFSFFAKIILFSSKNLFYKKALSKYVTIVVSNILQKVASVSLCKSPGLVHILESPQEKAIIPPAGLMMGKFNFSSTQ